MFNYNKLLMITILYTNVLTQQLQSQPPQQQTQIRFVEIPLDQPAQGKDRMNTLVIRSSELPTDQKPVQRQLTPEDQYRQEVLQVYGNVDEQNLMPLYEPRPISEEALQAQVNMPQQLAQQSYIVDPELQSFYDTYLPQYNQKEGIQQKPIMIQEDQLQRGFLDQHLETDGSLRNNDVEKEVADLSQGILRNRYIAPPKPKPKVPYPSSPKPKIYYTRQNKDGEEEVVKSRQELERERRPAPVQRMPVVENTNFYESANIPGDSNKTIDTQLIRYQQQNQQSQQVRGNRRSFPSNISEDYEGRFNKIQNPIEVPLDFGQNQQQRSQSEMTWEEYQQAAYEQEAINQNLLNNATYKPEPKDRVYEPTFVGQSQQ